MRRLAGRIEKLEAQNKAQITCNVLTYDPRITTAQAELARRGVSGVRYMIVADYGSDVQWEAALLDQQRRLRNLVREPALP